MANSKSLQILLVAAVLTQSSSEKGYLKYVKEGCLHKGEALSCIKYKAIKLATNTILGDTNSNETMRATNMLSFVSLDPELVGKTALKEDFSEPRGFMSEWSALAKYVMRMLEEFVLKKGLRVELPEGSQAVEEEARNKDDQARGKRKKLAVILPLLSLLATIKTKVLLIPVLLAVIFIKKLLLVAALLIPSLLSTLKACKMPHPTHHYSHFGSSDSASDFSSAGYGGGYGGGYSYSSGGPPGYSKDWAASRAYAIPKRPPPVYATAPGTAE